MSLQVRILSQIASEVSRWRSAGVRAAAVGILPVVLALADLRLAMADGGRHPATLAAVQTLVFLLTALLVALGAVRRSGLVRALVLLVLAVTFCAFWSVRPDSSLRQVLAWASYLGVVVVVSSSLGSPAGARRLTDAMLIIGLLLCLFGLYLFWGADNPRLRWYSTFYAPNAFAAFLLLVLPLAAARCALAPRRREAFEYGAVAVLLGLAFVLTYSRGAYVALGLASVAALGLLRPGGWRALRRITAATVVTVAAVTMLTRAPVSVVAQTAAVLDAQNSSVQDRLSFWRSSLLIFRDYPVTGSGPGTFPFVHGKYQGRYYSQDAHNMYLQALAETGAVGALALALMLVSLGAVAVRAVRAARGKEEYPVIAGISLSLLAFFLHSGVEMSWHFPANPATAFVLVGILVWSGGRSSAVTGGRLVTSPLVRTVMVCLLIGVAGITQILRIADAEFARGRRLAAARQWPGAARWFDRAATLNPLDPRAPSAHAVMLQRQQRSEAAIPLIRRAVALDRMNAYYPLQLAEALAPGAGDPAAAREVETLLRRGLDLDPFHYPEGYRRLAQLYAGQGRTEDAQAIYARAGSLYASRTIAGDPVLRFRLWPRVAGLFAEWAAFAAAHGSTDDAVGILDEVLRQDPAWQPAYLQIADLYVRAGRGREAAAALVAAWAERPDSLVHSPRPSRLSTFFPRVYAR